MKDLDRSTMDALGYFFVDIGLVPRGWASKYSGGLELRSADYRGPFAVWWANHQPAIDVRNYCDSYWSRTDPTGWYLRDDVHETSWSDDNDHRVEIVEDDRNRLVDLTVSIDIRNPFSDFINQLIEMAQAADCIFFGFENQKIIEPSREWLIKKVQDHELNHVVFDSSGKFAPN